MKFSKKGQSGLVVLIAVAALVLIALSQAGLLPKGGGVAPQTPLPGGAAGFCPDSSVTMTLGPASVWRAPTRSLVNEYHRVIVNNVDNGLIRDSQTLSVRVKNDGDGSASNVRVIYAENSTDYYGAEANLAVPCGAFTTAQFDKNRHILANNSQDVTTNVFNQDDGDLNSATNNQSITTGEEVTFRNDWFGTTDEARSPYGNIIAVVDYNDSEFDGTIFSLSGNGPAAVPTFHTIPHIDFKSKAWRIPGGPDPSVLVDKSGRWTFKDSLVVKADATVNPGGSNTRSYLNVSLYCEDWYADPDTTGSKFGSEDSRGTRTCFPGTSFVIGYT